MTTMTCSTCHDRFHAFAVDDDTCLSCLEYALDVPPPLLVELVAAVRAYAPRHSEDGKGWNAVVESFSDDELVKLIGKARTANGAIWAVWNKQIRYYWQRERDAARQSS